MHIGIIPAPYHGHLNPIGTLGSELKKQRGHTVTLFSTVSYAESYATKFGYDHWIVIGTHEDNQTLRRLSKEVSSKQGMEAMDLVIQSYKLLCQILFRDLTSTTDDGRRLLDNIDALVIDETIQFPLISIAYSCQIPVVVASAAQLLYYTDDYVPNFTFTIQPQTTAWYHSIERLFHRFVNYMIRSPWLFPQVRDECNVQRQTVLGLPTLTSEQTVHGPNLDALHYWYCKNPHTADGSNAGSNRSYCTVRMRITQMPNFFDFPRSVVPDYTFWTQPWVSPNRDDHRTTDDDDDDKEDSSSDETARNSHKNDKTTRTTTPNKTSATTTTTTGNVNDDDFFDWTHQLDGRPIIYVTLGTVQNGYYEIYRNISTVCCDLPEYQMIMTLGRQSRTDGDVAGLLPDDFKVPDGSIIVTYTPQIEVLKHASTTAMVCVGGMNTILEALSFGGVPMVTIPLGSDQPGNAARAVRLGVSEMVSNKQPTVEALRVALLKILNDESYSKAAKMIQEKLATKGPSLAQTAELIEVALKPNRHEPLKRSDPEAISVYCHLGDPVMVI